jgi:ATP-dependent DNA helicase 2 subunit 1
MPKYRQIHKRVGVETIEWSQVLEKVFKEHLQQNPDTAPTGSKRPTPNPAASKSTKVKLEDGKAAINEVEVRQLWQKGHLAKLTVAELKEFATLKGIAVSGRKADIVEKIEGWLESQ